MRMCRRMTMGGGPKKYKIVELQGMTDGRRNGVGAYYNGRATFVGGFSAQGTQLAAGECIASDGSRTTITMTYARSELSGAVDGDGSLILAAGNSNNKKVEQFNSSGVRSTLTDMLGGGQYSSAAKNGVGAVLIAGGWITSSNAKCNKYLGGVLSAMSNMSVVRHDLSGVTDGDGIVRFIGGKTDGNVSVGTHDYYSTADVRSTTSGLYTNRYRMAAATNGIGQVLVCGGYLDSGQSKEVDMFSTGVHTSLPEMTYARAGAKAIMNPYNGDVVIGGGTEGLMEIYSTAGVKTTFSGLVWYRTDLMAAYDDANNMLFAGGTYGGSVGAYLDKLSYN